jgi:hypothetical protein
VKQLAIIAGGWHFPYPFYLDVALMPVPEGWTVDLFCVAHRDPSLDCVRDEKAETRLRTERLIAGNSCDFCARCDVVMYEPPPPDIDELERLGWRVQMAPNTVGDWGFFNQWLDEHDYGDYDLLLNCHDDTFIRDSSLLVDVLTHKATVYGSSGASVDQTRIEGNPWLILGNGRYPTAPDAYVRGSFEFWKPRMLDLLGGKIDLGNISLTREGLTDSPTELGALMAWNDTAVPVRDFMVSRGLADKVLYLSPYYRISKYVIEGERGFISRRGGAPWSFEAGLKELAA